MASKRNLAVKQIVKRYIEIHGYDGLYSEECGCSVDDLMPCEEGWGTTSNCRVGYYRAKKMGEDDADYYIGQKPGCFYGQKTLKEKK